MKVPYQNNWVLQDKRKKIQYKLTSQLKFQIKILSVPTKNKQERKCNDLSDNLNIWRKLYKFYDEGFREGEQISAKNTKK